MIEISFSTLIMIYLAFTLGAIITLWVWSHLGKKKKKLILQENKLLTCEYCHFNYLADRVKKLTKCPSCSSYNKN